MCRLVSLLDQGSVVQIIVSLTSSLSELFILLSFNVLTRPCSRHNSGIILKLNVRRYEPSGYLSLIFFIIVFSYKMIHCLFEVYRRFWTITASERQWNLQQKHIFMVTKRSRKHNLETRRCKIMRIKMILFELSFYRCFLTFSPSIDFGDSLELPRPVATIFNFLAVVSNQIYFYNKWGLTGYSLHRFVVWILG